MENETLEKAFQFAKERHGDQMYGKFPYTYHLLDVLDKVIEMGMPIEYQTVALLHDTLETKTTWIELKDNFGKFVAGCVYFLTKDKGQSYESYIKEIKNFPDARAIKICDLLCNLKESYKMEDCEIKFKLIKKYEKALFTLASGE